MIQYSFYRILIFVVVLMGLYLTGLRAWLLLIAAAVISAIISLVLLNRPREKFAAQIEDKVEQRRAKATHQHRSSEDEEDDELDEE